MSKVVRKSEISVPPRSKCEASKLSPIVLTIGHSTRTIEEFIRLLQAHA